MNDNKNLTDTDRINWLISHAVKVESTGTTNKTIIGLYIPIKNENNLREFIDLNIINKTKG